MKFQLNSLLLTIFNPNRKKKEKWYREEGFDFDKRTLTKNGKYYELSHKEIVGFKIYIKRRSYNLVYKFFN